MKILLDSYPFRLTKITKGHRIRYRVDFYGSFRFAPKFEEIRAHFDPGKNRGNNYAWSYRNRKEAEGLITMALLKFQFS